MRRPGPRKRPVFAGRHYPTPHNNGRRIFAAIDGLDRYQDPHLGRNLNHLDSHKARLSPPKSGAVAPFQ